MTGYRPFTLLAAIIFGLRRSLTALNGEAGARDAGKLRQEGKEYVVKDGDVLHFKFNV